ncbi:hypothetical protein Btru_072281 [Bulinus truncatus]|nr:hypothetical protein Btru_072281 [Bulinus truncatus]
MNPVQQKISCVYQLAVSDEASNKRNNQAFKVLATSNISLQAENDGVSSTARPTEKLDGTCCLVDVFQGKPWLWARYDRKPSKAGERRLALFNKAKQKCIQNGEKVTEIFEWNPNKDFKEPPEHWVPASNLEMKDGMVLPDKLGHTPGWIPVQINCRQQCWHLSAVDLELGLALVLSQRPGDPSCLLLEFHSLSSLCGQTFELIGTNINGNPYNLGTKRCPVHILVPHGNITVECPTPSDFDCLFQWFESGSLESLIEGIVWHCDNGALYKLHRHHLNMKWPLPESNLCRKKVIVQISPTIIVCYIKNSKETSLFVRLSALNGKIFNSLHDLHLGMNEDDTRET